MTVKTNRISLDHKLVIGISSEKQTNASESRVAEQVGLEINLQYDWDLALNPGPVLTVVLDETKDTDTLPWVMARIAEPKSGDERFVFITCATKWSSLRPEVVEIFSQLAEDRNPDVSLVIILNTRAGLPDFVGTKRQVELLDLT